LGHRPSARAIIPLCRAGRHPSMTVSRAAMRLLSRIGPASLPAICDLIRSDAAIGREELYGETLAAIGPSAAPWLADRLVWRRGRLGTSTWQVVSRFVELCPCQELGQLLSMLEGQQFHLGRLHPNQEWLRAIQRSIQRVTSFRPNMPLAAAAPPTTEPALPVPSRRAVPACASLPVLVEAQALAEKRSAPRVRWLLGWWKGVVSALRKKKDH